MLNKENYVPWSSSIIRYARSRPNGKMIVDSIENGPYVRRMIATLGEPDLHVPVPESFHEQTYEELTKIVIKRMDANDQAIQTILLGLPEDVYSAEKKEKLFNEWEKFMSTDRESIESYYHQFMQLMNDLKRNQHFPKNIASNLKFLNNLQLEWKRHVTIVRQTKNLHEADFTQIYGFLKMNQDEVNELRAERLAKSHDPLALMAHSQNSFNFPTTHKDQSSSSTHSQQSFPINNKYNPQPSLSQNFMQPPMTSLEDINDPTEAMNAALILFAKAFQLSGYNAWQNGGIQGAQNTVQNMGAEGTGNGNQARCYNCRGLGHIARNCTARPRRRDDAYLQTQLLIARKEEARIQLQAEEFDFMAADSSAEVQLNDNCYDNEIFNMFTQEEHYTDLLKPIPKPQLEDKFLDKEVELEAKIKDLENILIKRDQTVQTMHKAQLKRQCLYNGNLLLEEHDPPAVYDSEETLELAQESREKMRSLKKEIKPANYAKINHLSRVFVPQTTKSKEELFLSNVSNMVTVSKMISIPNEDLSNDTTPSVPRKVQNFEIQFLQEAAKFVRDIISLAKEADESLDKQKSLKLEIKRLLKASVSHDIMSIVQNGFVDVPSDLRTELDRMSVTPHGDKPKLSAATPLSKKLHASMPSHSVPQPREFNVVKHKNRHVTVKKNLSSNTVTASSTGLVYTAKTRRQQPKGNTRNARIPSASKSSEVKKNATIEDHRTVRFGNDHIAAILGYGDLKWGNITITRVYFVEGLGHNLFSVGQFCNADLEVAFRRNTCFIRDLDGVDLLKGNHSINLYTINLYDMALASPICLMARATPTKSWLWHQQLSHLNFDTINDLAKNDLVSGLPKFKYAKEHLCPSCEQGKSKRASHPPKPVLNSKQRLHLLHMYLCGPMRVASINEVIKNFLKKIYVRFQAPVIIIRTNNETEFKNQVLKEYFDSVGITHETSATKAPQQNGVVKRINRTLVEAARTMLLFSHAPLFLWAEAIATACILKTVPLFTDNDREDIGKLGAKGDIGFFIRYSVNSSAYRVNPRRKDTKLPQPSDLTEYEADETVNEKMDDSLVRADTTASSLEVEQGGGNINKTQSKATSNEHVSQGTSSGEEINDIDADEGITLVDETAKNQGRLNDQDDTAMFDVGKDLQGEDVIVEQEVVVDKETIDEITLAKALEALKTSKPKIRGIVIRDPKEPRERTQQEEEANIALIETWDDVQEKIDADYQLAERLQVEEQ
nr:retrovirus-related Pol polyprotein from transposon TNT 1-94 [Tanacetum cinerariifolium]